METGKTLRKTLEIHFGCVGNIPYRVFLCKSTEAAPGLKHKSNSSLQEEASAGHGLSSVGIPLLQRFRLDLVGKILMNF